MDIGGWLRGRGLERHEQAFRENEIDLRVLPELTAGKSLSTESGPITADFRYRRGQSIRWCASDA